jgi:hypothetical protein
MLGSSGEIAHQKLFPIELSKLDTLPPKNTAIFTIAARPVRFVS